MDSQAIVALLTLTVLEVVLGIDNVIFISILSNKLPKEQQNRARQTGIALAVISRLVLLGVLYFVLENLVDPVIGRFSVRDFILIGGGLFLIGKATYEIHEKLEGAEHGHKSSGGTATFQSVITQVILIDVVFSLDSVITAVGIAEELWTMIVAILIAAAVMVLAATAISEFVEKHPTMKILALAFLILIGAILVFEGVNPEAAHELHIKWYAYFAIVFSLVIELINMRLRAVSASPVELRKPRKPE